MQNRKQGKCNFPPHTSNLTLSSSRVEEIERLQSREVQIKEMLFELLNRECEIAKIEEAKSMPTIQVLDKAITPEKGMGRGTAKMGILAGIATMMLGVFIGFGREYVAGIRSTM